MLSRLYQGRPSLLSALRNGGRRDLVRGLSSQLNRNPSFSIYDNYETKKKEIKVNLFKQFDSDGDGIISVDELQIALHLKDYQARAIIRNLDPDNIHNGQIDYKLFSLFVDNLARFDRSDTNRAYAAANYKLADLVSNGIRKDQPVEPGEESKGLSMGSINNCLRQMQYAVRGLVPTTAQRIAIELQEPGHNYPFDEVLFCNIGNPQSVGQKPITFYREVSALCDHPQMISHPAASDMFSAYSLQRAAESMELVGNGLGAYSESQGVSGFRRHVTEFIQDRDGHSSDPSDIFLTNGASSGIQMLFTLLIAQPTDAIMIPIPQYPIYSALSTLLDGKYAGYYLDENSGWSLHLPELERSMKQAKQQGLRPRAIAIINPGNPVGNVLSYDNIAEVIDFCKREQLVLLADEVYQENIYNSARPFVSAKKVLKDMGPAYANVEVVSYHSTSKGFIGECGRRGGYMELCGFDREVKAQLIKLASSSLCPNLNGQLMTDLMVKPPPQGSDAFSLFEQERNDILSSLKRKSQFLHKSLNEVEGVSCQPLDGAMYAFPKIELSSKVIEKASDSGQSPDTYYALSLLENTGLCCVPGSGFGQEEDTFHLRMTFLPEEKKLKQTMESFAEHHVQINS